MSSKTTAKKYRSKLERKVAEQLGDEWSYETEKLHYHIPRKYIVDFSKGDTYVEVKGYFRVGDALKYKSIAAECRNVGKRFVILFQSPHSRYRKDGRLTYAEWADKNNIEWYWTGEAGRLNEDTTH